jgi:methylisocitrate lyase
LTLTEVAQLAGYIAKAVKIPAIVDADTGFGGAENVARTIRELERAGLAGCHIEDQEFPKRCGHLAGKSVVDVEEMVGRIKAAIGARRDPNFRIIARTDARAVEGFDRAVERAGEYIAAGADAIFPEALQSPEEFRDFAREIDAPLLANMTEFGKSPLLSFHDLMELGYRMVIFPMSAFRVAMKASEKFFRALKESGTQKDWIDEMQTRQELYELLDYDPMGKEWLGLSD